jgi:hypothetical protein
MTRRQRVAVESGTFRYAVENALPSQLDVFGRETIGELEKLLRREVYKQLNELQAAWPKPPSRWAVRGTGSRKTRKWLKRTGKSEAAFRVERKPKGADVFYTIENDHVGADGFSYVFVVHTYDLKMDNRQGKMTRAWPFFKNRATIQVQDAVIKEAGAILKKGLK